MGVAGREGVLDWLARDTPLARPSQGHSHGHFKLLHPLALHLLRLAEELEALLALEVGEVEAVGPLWGGDDDRRRRDRG